MNVVDVLVLVGIGLLAFLGAFRGLAAQILSLGGLALGALAGSYFAPFFLSDNSPWIPLASLVGAAVGAVALAAVAAAVAGPVRLFLSGRPALATADRAGGVLAGAFVGIAIGWLVAVLALQQPALGLRREVRDSAILPRLLRAVPPDTVLQALNRFDPLPLLPGVGSPLPEPDPSVLQSPGTQAAANGVVKIYGISCGVGVQGSGWVVRPGLVATNAHVIAGEDEPHVLGLNGQNLAAEPVYVDATNDVALLRVRGLAVSPLAADREVNLPRSVALLGYPRNGPLVATAGTAGEPRTVLAPDAYDRRIRPRKVVPLRGRVQSGESGGPVVDRRGRVLAMIFGGTKSRRGGFAVPVQLVLSALAGRLRPVDSGPCIG